MKRKSFLADKVENIISSRDYSSGLSVREIAEMLEKSHSHINQIVRRLLVQGRIFTSKKKQNLQRSVAIYYGNISNKQMNNKSDSRNENCVNCHRYTKIERCSLLDLVKDKNQFLEKDLLYRYKLKIIPPDAPKCKYFDKRNRGRIKSKNINVLIKRKTSNYKFHCAIERCNKVISSLSNPLEIFKIGFTTFYCPHCLSPMVLKFNDNFNRYEIRYWDSRTDIILKDYRLITKSILSRENNPTRFGISIAKNAFYNLDLKNEYIIVNGNPITKETIKEAAYFPLRSLDYISCRSWKDYYDLTQMLHQNLESTNKGKKKLYDRLYILEPRLVPESLEPTPLEVGGNEIFIATKCCNHLSLQANLQNRRAILESSEEEGKYNQFSKSILRIRNFIANLEVPVELDFNKWQQLEGGCGSIMFKPFKQIAINYGFFAPSREKAREVKGEDFLPFMLFKARSDYHSAINGVNRITGNIIKEVVYTNQQIAFEGFRGWCHRKYLLGLFYDKFELAKLVALVFINEAIQNESLVPSLFIKNRGKRYDLIYGLKPSSEGETVLYEIAHNVLNSKIVTIDDKEMTLIRFYKSIISSHHKLFSAIALKSSNLIVKKSEEKKKLTPWKMLQQTKNSDYLPRDVFQKLKKLTRHFLKNEFPYQPLCIQEVRING